MHQRDDFKKLVQRSKTAGHENKTDAVFDEANFAGKKIMKMDRDVRVAIALLFVRQFDVQADGFAPRLGRAAIGRFHDARSAAGDDPQIIFRQAFANLHRHFVIRIGWARARRAENGHGRSGVGEDLKRIDKLRHDAKNAPGIFPNKTAGG